MNLRSLAGRLISRQARQQSHNAARTLRTPAWRRTPGLWLDRDVAPLLMSECGNDHVREVLARVAPRLAAVLARLDAGPGVLDDSTFASQLSRALDELTYCPEIRVRGTVVRAYCDMGPTLAVFETLLSLMARELELEETDVAVRLANSGGSGREVPLAAGRRLLDAGRPDEAAAFAARALETMSACPSSQRLLMDALRARRNSGSALSTAEENGLADLSGRFCARPFEIIVSGQSVRWNDATAAIDQVMGATYACDCAAWLPVVTGNMLDGASADSVWNSAGMQEVRRSVLDGDFSYCSRTLCPLITNAQLPLREEVTTPRLRRIIDHRETVVSDGPRVVALGHDSSCNLACPSCRTDLLMANREQSEQLDRARDRVILPLLRHQRTAVQMTSWGDPFGSRHYRSILEALGAPEYDGVRLFMLTNGLGLTAHTWQAMPHLAGRVVELRVSLDAASKETYEDVRRPGRWDIVRQNLTQMSELNRAGAFSNDDLDDGTRVVSSDLHPALTSGASPYRFLIAFVVQSANFREMPAFVALAEELGAGAVFQKYYSFGHEPADVYAAKDVTDPAHPEHTEFQAVLRHPAMRSARVSRTFVTQIESRSI